jgi:hypothetical protein
MDAYRTLVYVHVICSVLLTGQALFWFIMRLALRQRFGPAETADLLQTVNRARWPHVAVPLAWRLPLPWVTWLTVGVLAASGLAIVQFRGGPPPGTLWWLKMSLLAAVVVIQLLVSRRPVPKLIGINFALVLAIMLVSGWMIR